MPIAKKDNCIFLHWSDSTGAVLESASAKVGENQTYTAQYEVLELKSITAEFAQGEHVIYPSTPLDLLKQWLSVKGENSDGSPRVGEIDYALIGTLNVGSDNSITVQVKGTDITDTFNVIVTAISLLSIEITTPPTKTNYVIAENFDGAGMVVTATFSDGTRVVITDYEIEGGEDFSKDANAVTVSYTFDGVTKTASVPITLTTPHNYTAIIIAVSVIVFVLFLLLLLLIFLLLGKRKKTATDGDS